jgi:hypothetical protein
MSIEAAERRTRHAGLTIVVFGTYLVGLGLTLLLAPNLLLGLFGIPRTDEIWVRILGAVLAVIGYYQIQAAHQRSEWFMRASVLGRTGISMTLFGLVATGAAPLVIALFGAVDLAGAIWTAYALRRAPAPPEVVVAPIR